LREVCPDVRDEVVRLLGGDTIEGGLEVDVPDPALSGGDALVREVDRGLRSVSGDARIVARFFAGRASDF
jgi:hypothetical protein